MAVQIQSQQILLSENTEGYREYRIPGITLTKKHTLLLCCEARMEARSDWGHIDVLLLRKEEGAEHFEKQILHPFDTDNTETLNNPTLIASKNKIHLLFHRNYEEAFHCVSLDDGRTWSSPKNITSAFRRFPFDWNVCASGPGHGIRLDNGRLVCPVWLACGEVLNAKMRLRAHSPSLCGLLYSDDDGESWFPGPLCDAFENSNETCICALGQQQVLMNVRNYDPLMQRGLACTSPDGASIEKTWLCSELPDPWCFSGMSASPSGSFYLVHCQNGATASDPLFRKRINVGVSVSFTQGQSWQPLFCLDECGGYADLAYDQDQLFIFYEHQEEGSSAVNHLILARISL